jgi:hypothetical protein
VRLLRVRWSAAGKVAVAIVVGVLALRAVPALVQPPEPPPLAADVGLPRSVVGARPERGSRLWRIGAQRTAAMAVGGARAVARPRRDGRPGPDGEMSSSAGRKPGTPIAGPGPTPPAPGPAPEPLPVAPAPAPEPAPAPPPPSDGSEEFSPH